MASFWVWKLTWLRTEQAFGVQQLTFQGPAGRWIPGDLVNTMMGRERMKQRRQMFVNS